jgi:hypothetical protein
MCINREKICKLLGDQPSTWSRHAPLLPPDWCAEQFTAFLTGGDDPQYIVRLIEQVVTVSLETVKLVDSLPVLQTERN